MALGRNMEEYVKCALTPLIGGTPVLEINDPLIPSGTNLYVKLEAFNPNMSVKDRSAFGLIAKAMACGNLRSGGTVIESTSGNLGKSLAMLGASMGFRVIVVVDPKVPRPILNWYRAYGAQVEVVERPDTSGSFQRARIARVRELLASNPGSYWPNQYDNTDNRDWHNEVTGPEILGDAAEHGVDTIVGSVSTGGHLSGIGMCIKNVRPDIKIYAGDIEGSAIFGGPFKPYHLNGLGLGWRAENTSLHVLDGVIIASDQHAISLCRLMAKEHGLLLGGSSGVVLFAALNLLKSGNAASVLAVLPDSGVSYLDQIYDESWLDERGLVPLSRLELEDEIKLAGVRLVTAPASS
jgi:N-(2-amino-2-carboxyethyl)-L-glutamate synthase